jgi:aryl-alcohol dehydrogenase-like predicted oxidoreductase
MTYVEPFHFILGAGPFDWTAGEEQSHEILNSFFCGGGQLVDTSDSYGKSEIFIGNSGLSPKLSLISKVGDKVGSKGLGKSNIEKSIDKSLNNLNVDVLDYYFAHIDDLSLSPEQIYFNFLSLITGKFIKSAGLSNFSNSRLNSILEIQKREGIKVFSVVQYGYSVVSREYVEKLILPTLETHDIKLMSFFSLGKGFLTDKYSVLTKKSDFDLAHGGTGNSEFRTLKNFRIKKRVKKLSLKYNCTLQEIALAFINKQHFVLSPIAGVRNTQQLEKLMKRITLSTEDEAYLKFGN